MKVGRGKTSECELCRQSCQCGITARRSKGRPWGRSDGRAWSSHNEIAPPGTTRPHVAPGLSSPSGTGRQRRWGRISTRSGVGRGGRDAIANRRISLASSFPRGPRDRPTFADQGDDCDASARCVAWASRRRPRRQRRVSCSPSPFANRLFLGPAGYACVRGLRPSARPALGLDSVRLGPSVDHRHHHLKQQDWRWARRRAVNGARRCHVRLALCSGDEGGGRRQAG
jgi:hypothetical protein